MFQTRLNLRIRPTDSSWHFESAQCFASALARWSLGFGNGLSWPGLRLRPHQSRKWKSMLLSASALSRRTIAWLKPVGQMRSDKVTSGHFTGLMWWTSGLQADCWQSKAARQDNSFRLRQDALLNSTPFVQRCAKLWAVQIDWIGNQRNVSACTNNWKPRKYEEDMTEFFRIEARIQQTTANLYTRIWFNEAWGFFRFFSNEFLPFVLGLHYCTLSWCSRVLSACFCFQWYSAVGICTESITTHLQSMWNLPQSKLLELQMGRADLRIARVENLSRRHKEQAKGVQGPRENAHGFLYNWFTKVYN